MNKIDYLFETSWEICNKVGGIHTVLSTKAFTTVEHFHNNYICIGPDVSKESGGNDEFIEDNALYKNWHEQAQKEGLRIRIGRWNISGQPIVILVDFTPYFEKKNEIFTNLWLRYKLDSISGSWDYIEPALFGYAAGKVIESFYQFHCTAADRIVAHFHEWMTGTGILYLESHTPQIATVFTTHATALGRCIAGNGMPLYGNMAQYNPVESAQRFGIRSKFSLESLSAQTADAYSTVSDITNRECAAFFGKPADVVTINGFENNFVPQGKSYDEKRQAARQKLIGVASALLQQPIANDALLVINSGRYEFHNKGIDLFIQALAELRTQDDDREVVAFIAVPAGTSGIREELVQKLQRGDTFSDGSQARLRDYATHPLMEPAHDPIIRKLNELNIDNAPDSKIKVVFVPVYLNGHDGIFNLSYYDLLIGFDLSVFPSYYEPWGYTPLESVAFGIPTITTSLAGFGIWARDNFGQQHSAFVIERTDDNDQEVSQNIAQGIAHILRCNEQERQQLSDKACEIAQQALWKNLYTNYLKLYDMATQKSDQRYEQYRDKTASISLFTDKKKADEPKWTKYNIKSNLPDNLKKLNELAYNLWWSWNYEARELFIEIASEEKWHEYNENPVHILQILPLERLNQFSNDPIFVEKLDKIYNAFRTYMDVKRPDTDKIAYFSMEFGISNELKIFSGGLGMLAGDYLKEASDCNVNMIGIGLLYRYGYFTQQISHFGDQINLYPAQSFSKLPLFPLKDENGNWKTISIALPGRKMYARIWRVNVGRIPLFLMDTDFDDNQPCDRNVTHTLYGGDIENRLKQEILLGIGGVRMLQLMQEKPDLYHLNEGHAAFLTLERLRAIMEERHVPFLTAYELVRASSLYTTHTPVAAGHDAFSEDLMRTYFSTYPSYVGISWQAFMGLGRKNMEATGDKFSMSILACNLSQEINGVSRIHGRVSREMFQMLYEGHFTNELHIDYVTNGVHYPTWAHKRWQQFHLKLFGEQFINDRSNPQIWEKIYEAADSDLWRIKDDLRHEMIDAIKVMLEKDMKRRNESPALIVNTLKTIRSDVLTIGFARRFATYKRAHLLFSNEEKLKAIVNNAERPIQFLFAGKAHPHDKAGQDLIKRIIEFSRKPDFIGKIIFIENYDMILAKKLISGCDVWLNTPTRPLEASGTSGEKAIMNGVLNCSVLDGWWAEGYVEDAGWAINEQITYTDNRLQDELDAATLYSIFEDEIAPVFYDRNEQGIPSGWTRMMKNCFAKISPHFTMKRQLDDYYRKFYNKLGERTRKLTQNNMEKLSGLVRWKEKVLTGWDNIAVAHLEMPEPRDGSLFLGDQIDIKADIKLGNLNPEDVKIELVVVNADHESAGLFAKFPFTCVGHNKGVSHFECRINAEFAGMWNLAVRMIPQHPLLPHDMDFNLVKWL